MELVSHPQIDDSTFVKYCSTTLTPVLHLQHRGHVTASLLAEQLKSSEHIQLVQEQMTECSF